MRRHGKESANTFIIYEIRPIEIHNEINSVTNCDISNSNRVQISYQPENTQKTEY
jgi:hypothetical protein